MLQGLCVWVCRGGVGTGKKGAGKNPHIQLSLWCFWRSPYTRSLEHPVLISDDVPIHGIVNYKSSNPRSGIASKPITHGLSMGVKHQFESRNWTWFAILKFAQSNLGTYKVAFDGIRPSIHLGQCCQFRQAAALQGLTIIIQWLAPLPGRHFEIEWSSRVSKTDTQEWSELCIPALKARRRFCARSTVGIPPREVLWG